MHAIDRKRASKIIGGIWALSTLVATPTFVDYSIHPEPMTSQDVNNTTAVTSRILCKHKSEVFDKMNGFFILCSSYMIPQAFYLQSLLPSYHVHRTARTSDDRGSDVIIRVAQSDEDYKDVDHHRSSLLLRLAALLRSPCRCCKFFVNVIFFLYRYIEKDDFCVMKELKC